MYLVPVRLFTVQYVDNVLRVNTGVLLQTPGVTQTELQGLSRVVVLDGVLPKLS